MKALLLSSSILISTFLIAQDVIKHEIFTIKTTEKNAKTILFESETSKQDSYYVIKAKNETSKDFGKCKWISRLSVSEFKYFLDVLTNIEGGTTFESSLFNVKYKNNKINVKFNNTKCTSEHRIYYFQESCNRSLTFVLYQNQFLEMINGLNNAMNEEIVKK